MFLFYLLRLSISGIKNISKEINLEFYKRVINKKFDPEKYKIKAIYGENGSGKTAIVTAVSIIQDLFKQPMYLSQKETQIFLNELINKKNRKLTCSFEFLTRYKSDIRVFSYLIEIGLNNNNQFVIQHEQLRTKNGNTNTNQYKTVFETVDGHLEYIDFEDNYRKVVEEHVRNLLSQSTFTKTFINNLDIKNKEYNYDTLIYIIYLDLFFLSIRVYLDHEDTHESYLFRQQIDSLSLENTDTLEEVINLREQQDDYFRLNNCDLVKKESFARYEHKIRQLEKFLKLFKSDLQKIDIDRREDEEYYRCELILNYEGYSVNSEFESTGIKKMIRIFDCLHDASNGAIVFIDEMDSNINDVYLCKMIEYFMYYGKGQLCFTSHNLSPMTVLKENKNSIDFLSNDNHLVSWSIKGNATPDNYYRNGMIPYSPFNIDSVDFIGIFEDEE